MGVGYIFGVGLFERLAPRRWVRRYQRTVNRLFRPWIGRAHGSAIAAKDPLTIRIDLAP